MSEEIPELEGGEKQAANDEPHVATVSDKLEVPLSILERAARFGPENVERVKRSYLKAKDRPHKPDMCEGKSRQTGLPCCAKKMAGTKYCKHHGGKHKRGVMAGNFKHGEYSQYLPSGLLKDYEAAHDDPQLISHRADIALLHARVQQLIKSLHSGETGSLWKQLKENYLDLRVAIASDEPGRIDAVMDVLNGTIFAGVREEEIWQNLIDTIEKKSQIVTREWRRMVELHQIVTVEEAMGLIGQIIMAVRDNVQDQKALNNISGKISALLTDRSNNFETTAVLPPELTKE